MPDKLFYIFSVVLMLAWLTGFILFAFNSFVQLLIIIAMIEVIMSLIKRRKPSAHRF